MENLKITSIEDLVKDSQGEIVELPGWVADRPFVAKLTRPSLLALMQSGKIPNSLIGEANKLFSSGVSAVAKNVDNTEMMTELLSLLEVICEDCFVEPKYSDIKKAGVRLTDEQLLAVFSYTQAGVKSLEKFRE